MAVSDRVKSGPEKAPHRSLWKALGLTDEELKLPLIGVVSAKSECVPGHNHLNNIAQAVKDASVWRAACRWNSRRSASATASRWVMSA